MVVRKPNVRNLRDVSDFCLAWDDVKAVVSDEALRAQGMSEETRRVIRFMWQVTERHCKLDG